MKEPALPCIGIISTTFSTLPNVQLSPLSFSLARTSGRILIVLEAHHHCRDVIHNALLLSQPTLVGLINKLRGKYSCSEDIKDTNLPISARAGNIQAQCRNGTFPLALTCRHASSTVSYCPTISTASLLLMNSHTPSLARIMNLCEGSSSTMLWSGSEATPTLTR